MFKIAKNIKIGIKLDKSGFQKELNQLLKKGYDLNINSGNFKSVINEITNNTEKLRSKLNNIGKGSFDNVTKSAEKSMAVFTELAETMGKLNEKSQTRVKSEANAAELKQAQAINNALNEQYKKQLSLNNLKEQLASKINIASNNSLIDDATINKLKNQLNSITTDSSTKEINELKNAINNLSSSDSGIIRVQQAIIRLEEKISSIKNNKIDLINSNDLSELRTAESELEKLKGMLNSLKSGEVINGRAISNQINIANNSVRTLSNSFADLNTSGSRLSSTMRDIFAYAIGGTGIYAVINSVKNASEVVIELNKNMVDLKKVTDATQETYNNFLKNMHSVALELGTQSSAMVNATTNWAKTGKNLQEAAKLAENTVLLTKVGDVDNVNIAQEYMLPALQAFNIEAEKSITLIDKYNNISNNMATTVNDVGDAMSKSASSMAVAGNSLEETIALIATAESQTKLGGAEVGTALKTLSMRLATFKDTETGEVIPQMAEKIKELSGVNITGLNGQLKNTYEIYTEIGKVYKDLDKNTQLQLNEILGGKLRGNIVSAILTNVSELQRAYDLANNSAGSAMSEFEKYQEGIEYSIDRLKEQINGLYTSFMNSDFLKGLTDGVADGIGMFNKLVSTIGSFPTAMTLATGAVTIFNKSFRENIQIMTSAIPGIGKLQDKYATYVSSLDRQIIKLKEDIATKKMSIATNIQAGKSTQTLSKEVIGLQQQLVVSTVKTIALKTAMIAFQAITTSLISFGISALISGFSKLVDSMITTKDELNEMKESFSITFNETSELDSLVQKQRELKDQLEDTTLSADEQKTKKEELIDVQRQLAELLPDTATGFDEEGNKISEDTTLIQENIDKKKELLAMEAVNIAKETSDGEWNKLLNNYDKQVEKVKELQEIYDETPSPVNLENLTEAEDKLDSYKEQLKQLSEMMKSWEDAGFDEKDMSEMLLGDIYDNSRKEQEIQAEKFAKLKSLVNEYTASIQENTKAKEENNNVDTGSDASKVQSSVNALQSTYEKLGYTVKEATDRIAELNEMSVENKNAEIVKDATKAYGEAISKTKELDSLLKEINEEQSMTPELIMQLAESYPELGSRITDVASVQEFLNNKIQEQTKAQVEAYQIMVQNDQSYYNSKILNNEELNKNFQSLCASFVDDQGNAYSIDLKNYTSLAQLKAKLTEDLGEGVADFITNFVTANAEGYSVDLSNTSSWASSKAKILQQLNTQIKKLEKNMSSALSKIKSDSYTGMTAGDAEAEKLYIMASNQLNAAKAQYEEIQTEFSTYNKGFSSYTPSFSSGSFKGSGSGNKGSSGSSSSSKEVEDMESLVDRYHDLEDAINDVNNELETNKILQDGATGKDKIALMEKEIQLYKKQQQAIKNLIAEQKKEAQELKNSLSSQGVSFNSAGDISNYNQILTSKVNWANSLSGDAKEKAIEQVKELEEAMKSYDELVNKTIPSQEQEWESLNNTIKDVYKTQAELIADMEKNISETIEYELKKRYDAKKEALNKEKELYNKEYEEANFEEEMNTERNKLAEIQAEIDKVKNDTSRAGQLRLKQLLEEYEDQQKVINDKIKEQQNQAINDRFDEEEALLDKELEDMTSTENLSQMVAEAISTGMIKIGEETINVQNSMNDMLKETEVGFANVALQQSEWLSNLEQIKTLYSSINSIMSNAGMTIPSYDNISRSRSIGDISITTGGITITGNADSSTLGSIQDMLDAQVKEIYKNIVKKLS